VAVAPGTGQLELQLVDEGLVVEETGQLVVARLSGELRGSAIEVGDDALRHEPVDRVVEAPLYDQDVAGAELGCAVGNEPPEHAAQEQELRDDLAWSEAEGLPGAGVLTGLRGERAPDSEPFGLGLEQLTGELGDEGGHVAELAELPEPLQRR